MSLDARQISLVEEFQSRHRAGLMTLVFTDLAGSTALKNKLGDAVAGAILARHHKLVRDLLSAFPEAREVSTAGDSFFLVFDSPSNAVLFASRLHRSLRNLSKEVRCEIRDRVGIHVGEVFVEQGEAEGKVHNYSGIQVDTCARVMSVCEPERTLLTRFAFDNARQTLAGQRETKDFIWHNHGLYELKGVGAPIELFEVAERGGAMPTPLEDGEKAKRFRGGSAPGLDGVPEADALGGRAWTVRKREVAVSLCAALVVILVIVFTPRFQRSLAGLSYDLAYIFRPVTTPSEAVIVFMDEQSHAVLKQPDTAPWDHAVHAALVRRMTSAGAKAVVFDVLFTSNQPTTAVLAAACKENGQVFLAGLQRGQNDDISIARPLEELRAVASWGLVETFIPRVVARQRIQVRGDVSALILTESVAEKVSPGSVARAHGRWLNYYGPPGQVPNVSYAQALVRADAPDALFRGKVVFVGAHRFLGYTGGRGTNDYAQAYDEFTSPYSALGGGDIPGVELNATAFLNIARGECLRQISPWYELLIFLSAAVVVAITASFLPTLWAVVGGVAASGLVAFVSSWQVWQTHEWFSWAVVSFVEIPTIVLIGIAFRTDRLGREKKRLEQTLVAQRSELASAASALQTQAMAGPFDVPPAPRRGQPLIPDYELLSVIGKGAYGDVWLARDLAGSYRALKVVRAASFRSERPFEREFDGIKRFAPLSRSHPGLVDVLHLGLNRDEGWFFYTMETADDITAGRAIDPRAYQPKTLSACLAGQQALGPAATIQLGISLCAALEFLHENGLLHRDIKPANVLFVNGRPQLGDPGLVADADAEGSGATMLGTPGYIAPDAAATAASDVYSLGKLLYVAGFGRPVAAFPEFPTAVGARDSGQFLVGLNNIVLRACEKSASERYPSAAAMRRDLEELGRQIGGLRGAPQETS